MTISVCVSQFLESRDMVQAEEEAFDKDFSSVIVVDDDFEDISKEIPI